MTITKRTIKVELKTVSYVKVFVPSYNTYIEVSKASIVRRLGFGDTNTVYKRVSMRLSSDTMYLTKI